VYVVSLNVVVCPFVGLVGNVNGIFNYPSS
jgi:hypothetical protein